MCSTYKSSENRKTGSSKDGDWVCPDIECKNLNFARRNQCNRCGQDRFAKSGVDTPGSSISVDSQHTGSKKKAGIEIGKLAAEKSRGLFSAEDWQCSKCANVNWARRHTCNLCNAPRFCEVEERTGYGGGYNDRGVVEYKERSESDDDYDEFGRRKKKSNSERREKTFRKTEAEKMRKKPVASQDSSNEEEEDDETNEDLSKYDLWGSEEELDSENGQIDSTKSNKRTVSAVRTKSRSRSRSPRCFKERDRH